LHGVILVAGTCFTPGDWVWVYVQDATTTLGIVGVWVQASQNYTHCTGFQCYFVPGGAFSYTGATPCASDQRPLDVWAYDLGTNSWTPPVRVLGAECIIP